MKTAREPTKVRIFCTESTRSVKARVINKSRENLEVEMPTGFVMHLHKKNRPQMCYYFRIGELEFLTDGELIC